MTVVFAVVMVVVFILVCGSLDDHGFYVLLLYIFYVMESGRFSQSPAFFKRAGHNVEGFLLYVPLRRFYSVLYIPLFCRSREKCGRLSTIIPQSPHFSYYYICLITNCV